MKQCIIFGGTGYIGMTLAQRFAEAGRFDGIILADIKPPQHPLKKNIHFIKCDVRHPILKEIVGDKADWIFNLAAVHREPGHEKKEYFDTNLPGARNVCVFADLIDCKNICFTASIAVYGPTDGPIDEDSPNYPVTPYGISKLLAESIHEAWVRSESGRRLVVVRPGVIYGPGDPGNIIRMIRAIKRGYFFFPGSTNIHKSYGYIYGLLDAFEFAMNRSEQMLTFNYVEQETVTIGEMAKIISNFLGKRSPVIPLPAYLLIPMASVIQKLTGGRSPIHPVRVRKASTQTWIIPKRLTELGFNFKYEFKKSLDHWISISPSDFE